MIFHFAPVRQAVLLALLGALCVPLFPSAVHAQQPASQSSSQQAENAFLRGTPLPPWVDRLATLPLATKGETLSTRFADLQIHVDADSSYYVRRAEVAHQVSALAELGQVQIEFQPGYQQVQLHKLAVHRGKETIDKLTSADIRFLQRERNLESGIYNGAFTAEIVVSDLRVGDTLEYEYTVSGQNPVFGNHVMQDGHWDTSQPSAYRRIIIDMPQERFVDYRLVGGGANAGKPARQSALHRDGRRILRFEANDLPPILLEQYVPDDELQFRWMQFSDFKDWASVNDWALELFSASPSKGVLDGPLKAIKALRSKEEQVAKVLEYVQNEIRYLSISLGENSHRPYPPGQVLERRYGDCKDKSLLAVSMLRALGIQAWPVLVSTASHKGLDKMLPSPTLFNHAIVRVDLEGKEYYLDPTRRGQYGKLDLMGQTHADRQVLVVKPGSTGLSTIPQPSEQTMVNRRAERFEIATMDKPAVLVQRSEMHGAFAEEMRVALSSMGKQELHKAYESVMAKRYAEAQLAESPKVQDDRNGNTLVVEVRYAIPSLFSELKAGEGWSMSYLPSNMTDMFAPPGTARRNFPLGVPSYGARVEYDLDVKLPEAFNIAPASATRKVDDSVFTMARKAEVSRNRIRVNVQLAASADRVKAADVPQHYKNLQQYNEILSGTLNAFRSDMAGAAQRTGQQAAAPASAPKLQTEEERINQLVEGTSRAIAKAEAGGGDPVPSLCERAVALAWLGRKDEALKDAARSMQLQPSSSVALRCRADVNFALGRFKESEADYSKLIARGSDEPEVYQARGLASLYLNKLQQAQADLRVAAAKLENGIDQGRAAIWLQLAGGTPPASALEGDAAWLREVSTMLEGKSDPEQMITRASRNVTSGMDARLVEAYFYIGRHMLASGQKIKAKSYFQRAVNKRLLDNLYHIASAHELSRM